MESNALFYVIDVKTTYNMLLERPWMYQNSVVSSILHQCFKYGKNGQVAHFANAKFYLKDVPIEDVQSSLDK